jgi:cytoskeletal protein CcmA (bactofilin family)
MWKRDQSVTPSSSPPEQPKEPRDPPTQALRNPPTEASRTDSGLTEGLVMNLGKSVVIKGELTGSEDLTLCGQMEGSIKLPAHTLTIGSGADIKAEISAKTVVIMGAVTGNVNAEDKVEIQATGSLTGDIVCRRLVIVDGGRLCGKVQVPQSDRSRSA